MSWEKDKAKVFISHKDNQKGVATRLSKKLASFGISGFVADESIPSHSIWPNELQEGLQTMDAFLAVLSKDYFSSVWTNQEIGFAKAREKKESIPIFIYSIDGTDPEGFLQNVKAEKGEENLIIKEIRKGLGGHPAVKRVVLEEFTKTHTYVEAKDKFVELLELELKFDDKDIDSIVSFFKREDKKNQLAILLGDPILDKHSKIKILNGFNFYHEALQALILDKYSRRRYTVEDDYGKYDIEDAEAGEM